MSIHTESLTTRELLRDAIDVLRDGDVVLGGGDVDYAAADVLEVFVRVLDAATPAEAAKLREFARLVVEGWPI